MNTYSRARMYIDMKRVKELKEKKDIADLEQKREIVLAEISRLHKEKNKHYDWRTGKNLIKEGMTTAGLGMVNYPAEGDVDLEIATHVNSSVTPGTPGSGGSGAHADFGSYDETGNAGFVLRLDTTEYDTIKFNANRGGATKIQSSFANSGTFQTLSSGTNILTIPSTNRGKNFAIAFNANKSGGTGASGATISDVTLQRRTPINLFVPLDNPEANSFIRDGQVDNLSPEEKKKRLEEQLKSSEEYLNKMFGKGMPGTATQIADYNPQQSFMDIRNNDETISDTTKDIEPQPTPPQSSIPSLYQNRSAAWLSGAIGNASIETLTDNFRGTTVSVPRLVSLTKQIDRLDDMISRNARSSNVEQIQSLIDRRNNYQERLKAEIEGSKPDLKPITQVPSSSDNQVELEKNIEASLKQLAIDNKQLKGDALKRNIELAKDLGLDILTAVAMLTPIPGDEAAALAAQAAKAGVKINVKTATRPFQNASDDVIRAINRGEVFSRATKAIRNAPKGFKNDVAIEVKITSPSGAVTTKNYPANEILRFKYFQVNSHQPSGKLLTESQKKSFNDFIDKLSEKNLVKEGMTTAGLGMVNYPAAGDVNLDTAFPSFTLSGSSEIGVNSVVQNMQGDGSKFDTMVVTINTTSSDWVVVHGVELITYGSGGAGTHTVVVPGTHSSLYFSASDDGTFTASVQYQRRKPVNVFVGLDDPEANSFIRDGQSDNLSPAQRRKKVEEQLKSSEEYLNKMFGKGMPGTATQIADYEPQQSFADIAQGLPYTDEDDAFDDPYYTRPQRDLDDDSDFEDPFPDLPLARGKGNTQIAQAGPGVRYPKFSDAPGSGRTRGQKAPAVPGYKWDPHMQINVPVMPKAEKKQKTMVAHHKPQGETIMEKNKKSFSDFTKKIPGYYDGKPAPLGFPIVEPPKMKNGMHPDLVDGKKTAKRFNRLDPISAKAMPKTGNPHIDKKVKAAAKKPK